MKIINVMKSQATQDGDGVNISRVADFSGKVLDPFLMIDELKSDDEADYINGFPPHPHRGMETFTYMIKGGFEHQDQMGNKKVIADGDVQWMSTGFGVVHSEMPTAADDGMHGFQIWINMAAKDKLRAPIYQDTTANPTMFSDIADGVKAKSLAGEWQFGETQVASPLNQLSADAKIADVRLAKGASTEFSVEGREQVLLLVHTGSINGYEAGHLLQVDASETIALKGDQDSGALVFAANRLREPVAHMGPFVMNTQQELRQAVMDYQSGKMGSL